MKSTVKMVVLIFFVAATSLFLQYFNSVKEHSVDLIGGELHSCQTEMCSTYRYDTLKKQYLSCYFHWFRSCGEFSGFSVVAKFDFPKDYKIYIDQSVAYKFNMNLRMTDKEISPFLDRERYGLLRFDKIEIRGWPYTSSADQLASRIELVSQAGGEYAERESFNSNYEVHDVKQCIDYIYGGSSRINEIICYTMPILITVKSDPETYIDCDSSVFRKGVPSVKFCQIFSTLKVGGGRIGINYAVMSDEVFSGRWELIDRRVKSFFVSYLKD